MGKDIQIDIEQIKHIATSTMAQIQQVAHEDSTHFRDTRLTDSAFGGIHEGIVFGNQAQAAQEAFHKVINEVVSELENFGDNLLQSANSHEDNDQGVESTMAAMNGRYGRHHQWSSTEKLREEGRKNKDLRVPADGAVQSQDGGPGAPEGAAPGQSSGSQATDATAGGGMDGGSGATGSGTP